MRLHYPIVTEVVYIFLRISVFLSNFTSAAFARCVYLAYTLNRIARAHAKETAFQSYFMW